MATFIRLNKTDGDFRLVNMDRVEDVVPVYDAEKKCVGSKLLYANDASQEVADTPEVIQQLLRGHLIRD